MHTCTNSNMPHHPWHGLILGSSSSATLLQNYMDPTTKTYGMSIPCIGCPRSLMLKRVILLGVVNCEETHTHTHTQKRETKCILKGMKWLWETCVKPMKVGCMENLSWNLHEIGRLLMKACSTLSSVRMTNNGDRLKSVVHLSMQLVWVKIVYAVKGY